MVVVVLAGRGQRPDPRPVLAGQPHGLLADQVRLVQPRLDVDRRALVHPLDDVEEQLGLLAVRQVDRRVEHDRHGRLLARLHVLQADAQVGPGDLRLLGHLRHREREDDLPDLRRGPLGVGERREQRAGQGERRALHLAGELRGVPPDEVHDPRVATADGQRPPHGHRVDHVHVDDHGLGRVEVLQRHDVEPLGVPRPAADELRAREHPHEAPDQGRPASCPPTRPSSTNAPAYLIATDTVTHPLPGRRDRAGWHPTRPSPDGSASASSPAIWVLMRMP